MIKKEIAEKNIRRVESLLDKVEGLEQDVAYLTKLPNKQLVKAHVLIRDRLKALIVKKNDQIKYYNEKAKIKAAKKDDDE